MFSETYRLYQDVGQNYVKKNVSIPPVSILWCFPPIREEAHKQEFNGQQS